MAVVRERSGLVWSGRCGPGGTANTCGGEEGGAWAL